MKTLAAPLASWLETYLRQNWICTPRVPQLWKDAHLALLAKRSVQPPADLRPNALTCSLGKAVLGAYKARAQEFMLPVMRRYPIFAYLPFRGVQEALFLAFDFCNEIRALCQPLRPGPWRATTTTRSFGGGLMLSLDLKQAYDRLPRRHLHSGLHYCGCPPELSTVLLQWLHEAQYHVHHRGLENKLTTV